LSVTICRASSEGRLVDVMFKDVLTAANVVQCRILYDHYVP